MNDMQYGGFWRRFFAFVIDRIILYFVTIALFVFVLVAMGRRSGFQEAVLSAPDGLTHGTGALGIVYFVLSILAGMAYFTWFHGILGRTPGKMALGLLVVQASGDPMTPGVAFLRWVGYLISGLVFGLGFLWIAFDGRKQGWHDKIAATLVIRQGKKAVADTGFIPAGGSSISAAGTVISTIQESSPPLSSQPDGVAVSDSTGKEAVPETFDTDRTPADPEKQDAVPPAE